MAQRSHVPQFGNWEHDENVPYTAYFDKARKGRTAGKIINPNDPEENPEIIDYAMPTKPSPARATPEFDGPPGHGGARRVHERQKSREDGSLKQFADSPGRHDNVNRRAPGEMTPSRYGRGGEPHKRPVKASVGSEHSMERSPLHHQARFSGRNAAASPAWEGKTSYDSSHGTPGRSRMKPNSRADESPDKGAAVPKFGEWDESNPASADGYTHIFNKVREEKNNGGRAPMMPGEQSPYRTVRKPTTNDSSTSCCFPWCRK